MSGRILVTERDGGVDEGGDYVGTRPQRTPVKPEWDRFTLHFADGGALRLFDKRRLGRVRLDPDIDALGPDAGEVRLADFRELVAASRTPVKARLLDQHAVAGIGNLLADEVLWQAAIAPERPADELDATDVALAAPRAAQGDPPRDQARRGPHRRGDRAPQGRRALPALRRADAAYPGRRPHHLGLLGRATGRLVRPAQPARQQRQRGQDQQQPQQLDGHHVRRVGTGVGRDREDGEQAAGRGGQVRRQRVDRGEPGEQRAQPGRRARSTRARSAPRRAASGRSRRGWRGRTSAPPGRR